jgi:hypothetical protein
VLSSQIIEFPEGSFGQTDRNFTQHSEPFKHDAARWARSPARNELQPFFEFDAERVVNELPEVVNIPAYVRKCPLRRISQPHKKFFKNKPRACAGCAFCADLNDEILR